MVRCGVGGARCGEIRESVTTEQERIEQTAATLVVFPRVFITNAETLRLRRVWRLRSNLALFRIRDAKQPALMQGRMV